MRWSQFVEKECVNMDTGEKLGTFHRSDLVIDQQTGEIQKILLPLGNSIFRRNTPELSLSWSTIQKIGPELVIVQQRVHSSES
ncbi:YlmC/YmxH family sporulation protein [Shimazuella sp. AN120528]|uniref:YlmC/YmxH family sporulation protein n=1 Tax=Shimazuella soli TaxID=1892854 RepID=UPI001F0E848B|nr:YlmC/YmxH family sporulation protein [Shimazuella soli]MCH5586274.1 YlmC/YmxH family sporulation protein [Shimazuella soli]